MKAIKIRCQWEYHQEQEKKKKKSSTLSSKQCSNLTEEDRKDNNNAAEGWVQVEGKEEGTALLNSGESNISHNSSTPYLRTISTFHSLTILIPLLYPMLTHAGKSNRTLQMSGRMARNKDSHRKSQVYMIFSQVYSITTLRAFDELDREFGKVLSCLNLTYVDLENARRKKEDEENDDSIEEAIMNLVKSRIASLYNPNHRCQYQINSKLFSKEGGGPEPSPTTHKFSRQVDQELIHPLHKPSTDRTYHQRSICELHKRLTQKLSGRYRGHTLTVYGSCLSGLALGTSSDVDISLYLPELQRHKDGKMRGVITDAVFERQVKNAVYTVTRAIERQRSNSVEFVDVVPVTRARVPVVKGTYLNADNPWSRDGSIFFDICFLNDIAVKNSCLIKEYSLYDARVKYLMLAVKSWTKYKKISSAAENTLSSYSWMNLVIFYLQCVEFVPNLQCPQLMEAHGVVQDSLDRWSNIDGLKTVFVSSDKVKERGFWKPNEIFASSSVSWLLMGFFKFYARQFPFESVAVSIRHGKCVIQKSVFRSARLWRICIEDPFETHDSHIPHDLGTPLTMEGQFKINKFLTEAAESMTKMMEECDTITDCIGSYLHVGNIDDSKDIVEKEIMNRHTKTRGAPRSHPTSIEKSRKKRHRNGSKRTQTKKENDKSGHGKDKERGRKGRENIRANLKKAETDQNEKTLHPLETEPKIVKEKQKSTQDTKADPNKSNKQQKPKQKTRPRTRPRKVLKNKTSQYYVCKCVFCSSSYLQASCRFRK